MTFSTDLTQVPKDRPILLCVKNLWREAEWDEGYYDYDSDCYGNWHFKRLPSDGCGCCSTSNPAPIAWAELPGYIKEPV